LDDYSLQSDRRQVHFSHRYEPASDMAGDFFEIMPISDTQLGVLICDVMGHGVRSSLIVSMLRGLIEKEREAAVHPEWFIYGINDGLVSILERAKVTLFATAIYCVIDLKRGTFQYTTAGHHAPIIVKDGQAQQLEADQHKKPEPALGLIPNAPYTSETIPLDNIDRVLLFTDGLYEIENHDGQHLEIDKITAMMMKTHDMDLDKSLSFLISQARQHSRYGEFDDDLCLLGMDIKRLEQT
jgi:serine phosphatase RsbU (regulator of sigma subunit)